MGLALTVQERGKRVLERIFERSKRRDVVRRIDKIVAMVDVKVKAKRVIKQNDNSDNRSFKNK